MAFLNFGASECVFLKVSFFILLWQNGWGGNHLHTFMKEEKKKNIEGIPGFFLEMFSLKEQKIYS